MNEDMVKSEMMSFVVKILACRQLDVAWVWDVSLSGGMERVAWIHWVEDEDR